MGERFAGRNKILDRGNKICITIAIKLHLGRNRDSRTSLGDCLVLAVDSRTVKSPVKPAVSQEHLTLTARAVGSAFFPRTG